MNANSLQVNANTVGGYFSSEQIDLLSIIRCNTIEELVNFVNNCIQVRGIYTNEELTLLIKNIGLDNVKRKIFKDYQDSMVLHDSNIEVIMKNAFQHLGIKNEDIEIILTTISNLSQSERVSWTREYIKSNYPDRSDEIFYALHNFRSIERDQNKAEAQYDEISVLNDNFDNFDVMILGSGRVYNVLNSFYEDDEKEKRYCFDRIKKDLDFAYQNGKQARYHSLLVQEGVDRLLEGKKPEEIKEILKNYVKESIDFINEYNATHKLNINGEEVGAINSVILFNEIVSFWKNENGEYFNIWEEKFGFIIKDLAEIFQYALEHKPDGVSFIYNEPFLEDEERRKKVFEVLGEIEQYSPGLIDTLGSQMHITLTEDEEKIERCFEDFKSFEEQTGKKVQITEFDMSLGKSQAYKVFIDNYDITLEEIYELKAEKIKNISDIINNSGVLIDEVYYWSLTDGVDFNLERVRSELLKEGKIESIDEIPTVCGGLYPTHKELVKEQQKPEIITYEEVLPQLQVEHQQTNEVQTFVEVSPQQQCKHKL